MRERNSDNNQRQVRVRASACVNEKEMTVKRERQKNTATHHQSRQVEPPRLRSRGRKRSLEQRPWLWSSYPDRVRCLLVCAMQASLAGAVDPTPGCCYCCCYSMDGGIGNPPRHTRAHKVVGWMGNNPDVTCRLKHTEDAQCVSEHGG